jgi:hypothetical protein
MYAEISLSSTIPILEKVDGPLVGYNVYEACVGFIGYIH